MGADLTGFIWTAPTQLTPDYTKVDWKALSEEFKTGLLTAKEGLQETSSCEELLTELDDGARIFLLRFAGEKALEKLTLGELLKKITLTTFRHRIEKVVSEFTTLWNEGHLPGEDYAPRRWIAMEYPEKGISVGVCAEMSWGDIPLNEKVWRLCEEVLFLHIAQKIIGLWQ